MLWRYAGNPAATDKEPHFTDTDESSAYARDALLWVVEKGILICAARCSAAAADTRCDGAPQKTVFSFQHTKVEVSASCHGLRISEGDLEHAIYETLSTQARIILNLDTLTSAG